MTNQENPLIDRLPNHLAERTRQRNPVESDYAGGKAGQGQYVLYWLHHAMRAHENPALDVALTLSNDFHLPVIIYQGLPLQTPYASDRHHWFVLEGARDLQQQFAERDLEYWFHLETAGNNGPHLQDLCRDASFVVTDDLPVDPFRTWTSRLAESIDAPLLSVDTACVAPMPMIGKDYVRAFQYRQATRQLYAQRLERAWSDVQPTVPRPALEAPFECVSLTNANLPSLVSECDVDHTIGPVPHAQGGSSAGYARWEAFQRKGLSSYAKRRNNPLIDGTSRLSAYLHYGMVSPFRIARDAALANNAGAEKFLDELLIWRELAYAFCFYRDDHENLNALPSWARDTLTEHQSDPRPAIHTWETLARGRTNDPLWDAAQRSLLRQGELHNNVRMTWGKAILNWTPDPETALATMIDLNHRYALDGRDPASYGGLLWCLGQFDRPFPPERPILGTVRDRSTRDHAKRLDVERYSAIVERPLFSERPRVAIIGAGLSGLMCGRILLDHGLAPTFFEKSRGVGGRMATRRANVDGESGVEYRFDHGAQYFTVRDERFRRYVTSWQQDGIVAPWQGRIAQIEDGKLTWKDSSPDRYVGVPGMNAVCRHLATELDIRFRVRAAPPTRDGTQWQLSDDEGKLLGEYDYVFTSAPAAQSAELLREAPELQHLATSVPSHGCWAVLLAFEQRLDVAFDGAFVHNSPLSWIARNASKPGRSPERETWVLHASPQWSDPRLDEAPEVIQPLLLDALSVAIQGKLPPTSYVAAHRWRFALPPDPVEQRSLFDPELGIGACGDWCGGPRVEGAFLSGAALAGRLLTHLASREMTTAPLQQRNSVQ